MLRTYFLPFMIILFGIVSLTTLRSVAPSLVITQAFFFVTGLVIFWAVSQIGYQWLQDYSPAGYFILVSLLALTLLIGGVTRGSTRWITIGGVVNIQPSQIAVPIVLLVANRFVLASAKKIAGPELFKLGVIVGLPALLIFVEPNLSTTLLSIGSVAVATLMAPVKLQHVLLLSLGSVCVAVIAWIFLIQPYQKERIFAFLASDQNPQANYHAQQSMIAVGSGQTWGRGLGQGVQSHLRFLPERQTDFIFASLAEELGFVGSMLVIGLFVLLLTFFLFIAAHAVDPAHQYYMYGLTMLVGAQTFINIGMNLGLLPITGVTLPLISYGGSSVLSFCAAYGVVQAIVITQKKTVLRHFV